MVDLNKAIKEWLLTCPHIKKNNFYFQLLKVGDNKTGFTTVSNAMLKKDVLGIETCVYSFSFIAYTKANPNTAHLNDENFNDFESVQAIAEWIREQANKYNYPNFQPYTIQSVTVPQSPQYSGTDTSQSTTNPFIKYMLSVQIEYEKGA